MFARITRLHYKRSWGREHIWSSGEGAQAVLLAGAMLGGEVIRIRLIRGMIFDEQRYQLASEGEGTLPYHSWTVARGDEQWPEFADVSAAQEVLEPYLQDFAYSRTELRLIRSLADTEYIYGFGERTGDMNKRNQAFPIWNVDPAGEHGLLLETMYTSIPFYIAIRADSGRAHGVLLDYAGRVEVDMGKSDPSVATLTISNDSLVVYYFRGPTVADVMRQYTELTGRMPLPPRWALGHHQCRWSYASEEEVLALASRLRERRHPCDAVWLDIDYMDGYRNFTWNPQTFSDPLRLSHSLHEQHFHLVTIVDPGTKVDDSYHVYREAMENDYLCRYRDGEVFKGSVWPGESVFPDFSRSEVRRWWGNQYQSLLGVGVDAIWNDMNEPALTNMMSTEHAEELRGEDGTMSVDVLHRAGGDQPTGPDGPPVLHKHFHNAYGMQMARATYEGLSRLRPDIRPFVLTRSGTAGMQRYAALWTGDNRSEWEFLPLALRMCLNVGMSGVPFVGADIGGFWGPGSGELLVRFAQLGTFMPFCRNHNALGNPDQEPWAFGEAYENAYRKAIEIRYRLLPYLYTLFRQAAKDGSPIMRPLYYHYPQDRRVYDLQDEFLLGETLLSAPIYEAGATSRNVYLPEGLWFNYWDGAEYPGGGTSEITASLETWPLFVRANSILPTGPLMLYTDQLPVNPLTFTCYMATDGLASYTQYEDDGSTLAYKKGAFAETTISCRVAADMVTVRIDERQNGYAPPREAYEIIVLVGGRRLQQRVPAGQGEVKINL